jgi:TolA-binding protein
MKSTLARLLFVASLMYSLTGCSGPPQPPRTADDKLPTTLGVTPGDAAEVAAATAAESARVNYRYRLTVLNSYYVQTGNMDKSRWAQREMENIDKAQTFQWSGIPEITPPVGESLANADEHLLVEYVLGARTAYLSAMRNLLAFYRNKSGDTYKAQRISNVLDRFDPIYTYKYFLEAEMPPATNRPVQVIPAADKMYDQAVKLHKQGKGLVPLLGTSYPKEREALLLLLDMVNKYPQSTKAALAAFYIGEIYKEYFNENIRAVAWYKRAVQWDPNLTMPARFQAAVVADYRLYNKAEAIELYRQVIQHEQFNASNVQWAHNRIRDLTGT